MNRIKFTQATSHDCDLAKSVGRDADGNLVKSAIAHMTSGYALVCELESGLSELEDVLPRLARNQAIICGVPKNGGTKLTTRAGEALNTGAVARTNDNFQFVPGPSLFPIDVDIDDGKFSTVNQVLDALEAAHPWFSQALRVARPSASSYVAGAGLKGVHVYLALTNGQDTPTLAKRMQLEQWRHGDGEVKISKSGALLVRQLFDVSIYQPSRLMFEAQTNCRDGVTRDVPDGEDWVMRAPHSASGPAPAYRTVCGSLDVRKLPALPPLAERQFHTLVTERKRAHAREAKQIALAWHKTRYCETGGDPDKAERYALLAARALDECVLPHELMIAVKDAAPMTVAAIAASYPDCLGHPCADPFDGLRTDLQPNHYTKAEICEQGGKLGIWSHKMQMFFPFADEASRDLQSPLEIAAEKLVGNVDYPKKHGKKSPLVNLRTGLYALLSAIDCIPRKNLCAIAEEQDADMPKTGALCDGLSRIGCEGVTTGGIQEAIETIAEENAYDPWLEAVGSLPGWDGVARLDTFCHDVFGTPDAGHVHVLGARLIFAGPVARQMYPGADCGGVVPVLYAPKGGERKSSFIKDLAKAIGFPTPAAVAFGDDIRMTMNAMQSGIVELEELAGASRREAEEIKGWTGRHTDTFRAPYDRSAKTHDRRFFAIATANKDEILRDMAMARRFLTIHVAKVIDPAWTLEARQLFAEAKARFCATKADFEALASEATYAVQAHNAARMKRGEGVAITALEDVLPEMAIECAKQDVRARLNVPDALSAIESGRVRLKEIKSRVVTRPETKDTREGAIVEWLTRVCGPRKALRGDRFWTLPQEYVDDLKCRPAGAALHEQARDAFNAVQSPRLVAVN